jgi:hypothetical protein
MVGYVDVEQVMYITSAIWSGQCGIEDIILVPQSDLDYFNFD